MDPYTRSCTPTNTHVDAGWHSPQQYYLPCLQAAAKSLADLFPPTADLDPDGPDLDDEQWPTADEVPSEAKLAYVQDRKDWIVRIVEDAKMLVAWVEAEKKREKDLKAERSLERREEIERRMRALGYSDADFSRDSWKKHALVRGHAELTTAVWERSRPILCSVLDSNM